MAVAFRSSDTYTSGSGTSNSVVLNAPAGVAAYDYLIVVIILPSNTTTITPPSDWILRGAAQNIGSGAATMTEYYKIATASEPSSYTFGLSASVNVSATVAAYSGVDRLIPNGGSGSVLATGASTGLPNNTAQLDGAYVVSIVGSINTTAAVTVTGVASGFTKRTDVSTSVSSFMQVSIADGNSIATRLDNTGNATNTLSGSTTGNAIFTMYLRPDTTAATTPSTAYLQLFGGVTGVATANFTIIIGVQGYLYALIFIQDTVNTVTSITSSGMVWTKLSSSRGSGTGGIELWQSYISLPNPVGNSIIVTVNFSGNVIANFVPYSIVNGVPGTISVNSGTSTTRSTSLTTTANNSLVISSLIRVPNNSGSIGAGQTIYQYSAQTGSGSNFAVCKSTSLVATAGTVTTHSYNDASSSAWAMLMFEVVPYVNKSSLFPHLGM